MHAAIAALSSNVPTIMLSWSHKYSGLMQEIGLEHCVWQSGGCAAELEQLIDWTWERRGPIRAVLEAYNETAREAVQNEVRFLLEPAARRQESSPVNAPRFATAS